MAMYVGAITSITSMTMGGEDHTTPPPSGAADGADGEASSSKDKEQPERKRPGLKAGTPQAKRGGHAVRDKYGKGFYSEMGRKGGGTTRDKYGVEYMRALGSRGGEKTRDTRPDNYFAEIGRKGGQARRAQHTTRNKTNKSTSTNEEGKHTI